MRPEQNEIELNDGRMLAYDYLVIATGPALAFDEIDGLGPDRNSISICHVDHAAKAAERWRAFLRRSRPDRRRRGAGRIMLRPGL